MEQEEKERIIIPDEDGNEQLFVELFKFHVDETDKTYILLIPEGSDENDDDVEVQAFVYEDRPGEDPDLALYEIETDEEWELVEEMLATFTEENDEYEVE
ncbi:MAG TPA: DUF1292 domain-containing protein [Bacilli bacterium]|nr:DUF1292 domain-containing protein [Bacilli bacterium]